MTTPVTQNDWILDAAIGADIDELMRWFQDKYSITIWGGAGFRFPFTRHSFVEDMHWGRVASFSLRDPSGKLSAFGQLYERLGRVNLARLVVNPTMRGQGVGKRLIGMLMTLSPSLFDCDEYSLFVYRDNTSAYKCYQSMGFTVTDYPQRVPFADACYYLTRPVLMEESQDAS